MIRILFWILLPLCIGMSILLPVFAIPVFFALLGLYDSVKFWWALRIVSGMIFLSFLYYLVYSFIIYHGEIYIPENRAERCLFNSILGFLTIGIPSLIYTIRGSFKISK